MYRIAACPHTIGASGKLPEANVSTPRTTSSLGVFPHTTLGRAGGSGTRGGGSPSHLANEQPIQISHICNAFSLDRSNNLWHLRQFSKRHFITAHVYDWRGGKSVGNLAEDLLHCTYHRGIGKVNDIGHLRARRETKRVRHCANKPAAMPLNATASSEERTSAGSGG